jgi:hypothetical protein
MLATLLSFFMLDQFIFYQLLNVGTHNQLSQKQKAYILSLKSSLTMFIGSIYSNYIFFIQCEGSMIDFIAKENFVNKLLTIFFISYLIVDMVIGTIYYKHHLCNLAGYPHHIVYIIVCLISLHQNSYQLFMLYMICELPTFILALGNYDEQYRQDTLFGITFFLTRIVHFMYISTFIFDNTLYIIITFCILSVHIFWFYNWCKKYSTYKIKTKKI